MRKLTAVLMILLAIAVIALGDPSLESDRDSGESFDLADEVAFEADSADICLGPGAAEDLGRRVDERSVGACL